MKHGADWYKREPRAMIDAKRAAKLTPLQAAIYDIVIDLIYEGAGETPNAPDYFAVHFAGVTAGEAEEAVAHLIAIEKLLVAGKCLTQSRAKREAKSKQNLRDLRSKAGKIGGKKSGEARRNNDFEASASTLLAVEKSRVDDKAKVRGPNGPPMSASADLLGDDPPPDLRRDVSRETIKRALDEFAAMAAAVGISIPRELTAKRKQAVGARIREHGEPAWAEALLKIRSSAFLRGEGGRDSWRGADIDWLTRPANFTIVLEGKYDDKGARASADIGKSTGVVDDIRELIDQAKAADDARTGALRRDG